MIVFICPTGWLSRLFKDDLPFTQHNILQNIKPSILICAYLKNQKKNLEISVC